MERKEILVAIPIFDGFTALDVIGPFEVLHRIPGVRVVFVSRIAGLYVACDGHLRIEAPVSFEQVLKPDVLLVPGSPFANLPLDDKILLNYIAKVHKTSIYTVSVCTGALLLGEAGVLKNVKRGTTHWSQFERLASYGVEPVHERSVREGKILMAAGVSAGIDSALELASLISNELIANAIQLLLDYDPRPPFNSGSILYASEEVIHSAKKLSAALPVLRAKPFSDD